jgi:hypothetical protein
MADARPPDDTPTRLALKGVNHSDDQYHLKQLRAEVSRLREALDTAEKNLNSADTLKSLDLAERIIQIKAEAEADVSRLQQENALLRRSLEVLCREPKD